MILARMIRRQRVVARHGRVRQGVQEEAEPIARQWVAGQTVPQPPGVDPQQIGSRLPLLTRRRAEDGEALTHKLFGKIATREGMAWRSLPLPGSAGRGADADVKNSTFSDVRESRAGAVLREPHRRAGNDGRRGWACARARFRSRPRSRASRRAHDFIRMAAISGVGIAMAGSHAGVSTATAVACS